MAWQQAGPPASVGIISVPRIASPLATRPLHDGKQVPLSTSTVLKNSNQRLPRCGPPRAPTNAFHGAYSEKENLHPSASSFISSVDGGYPIAEQARHAHATEQPQRRRVRGSDGGTLGGGKANAQEQTSVLSSLIMLPAPSGASTTGTDDGAACIATSEDAAGAAKHSGGAGGGEKRAEDSSSGAGMLSMLHVHDAAGSHSASVDTDPTDEVVPSNQDSPFLAERVLRKQDSPLRAPRGPRGGPLLRLRDTERPARGTLSVPEAEHDCLATPPTSAPDIFPKLDIFGENLFCGMASLSPTRRNTQVGDAAHDTTHFIHDAGMEESFATAYTLDVERPPAAAETEAEQCPYYGTSILHQQEDSTEYLQQIAEEVEEPFPEEEDLVGRWQRGEIRTPDVFPDAEAEPSVFTPPSKVTAYKTVYHSIATPAGNHRDEDEEHSVEEQCRGQEESSAVGSTTLCETFLEDRL